MALCSMANGGMGHVLCSFCIAAGVGRGLDTYVCPHYGPELVSSTSSYIFSCKSKTNIDYNFSSVWRMQPV